jgi:hypothetical protein
MGGGEWTIFGLLGIAKFVRVPEREVRKKGTASILRLGKREVKKNGTVQYFASPWGGLRAIASRVGSLLD